MQLTHPRFRDFKDRTDLLEIEFLLIVQRQYQPLAFGKLLQRIDDGLAQ